MTKRKSDLPELAPLGGIAEAANGANVHDKTVGVAEAVVDREDQHAAPNRLTDSEFMRHGRD